MKTLAALVCVSLLAGCTSATIGEALTPSEQSYGYPRIQSLPLPSVPTAPTSRVASAAPRAPAAPLNPPAAAPVASTQGMAVAPAEETASYDEKRDPAMRDLLAQATRPVEEDLHMTDGKLVLPPPPKLEIIDVQDVTGALKGASATPSS